MMSAIDRLADELEKLPPDQWARLVELRRMRSEQDVDTPIDPDDAAVQECVKPGDQT